MLFFTTIIVKEVLLIDTGAVTQVPVITIGPTHMQGIMHPNMAMPKNQHVIIARVHII